MACTMPSERRTKHRRLTSGEGRGGASRTVTERRRSTGTLISVKAWIRDESVKEWRQQKVSGPSCGSSSCLTERGRERER